MNVRKLLLTVGIMAATVAAAWLLGVQAGNLVNGSNEATSRERRSLQTASMLKEMGTIGIGDTLPDYALQDLSGTIWKLSELVSEYTLVTFFKPDCGACELQIAEFSETLDGGLAPSQMILVSPHNPLQLKVFADMNNLQSVLLYDEERMVQDALGITVSPFNIILNRSLQIERIEIGVIRADELLTILSSGGG